MSGCKPDLRDQVAGGLQQGVRCAKAACLADDAQTGPGAAGYAPQGNAGRKRPFQVDAAGIKRRQQRLQRIAAGHDDPGGGVTWQTIAYTHDANGNLTGDGLYKYTYDAWNRLAGVWYHDCAVDGNGVPSDANERVARYRYDGLFRRVSKQVTNQGTGVVFRSDDLDRNGTPDATGILAGDRHEHYFYAGWRLVETTNHVTGGGGYSYGDSAVLNQFVYWRDL